MNPAATSKAKITVNETRAAQLRHLEEASKLLFVSSPSTSAYLASTRRLLVDAIPNASGLQNDGHECQACGNILLVGWSCKIQTHKTKGQPRRSRQQRLTGDDGKSLRLECLKCGSMTELQSKRPKRAAAKTASSKSSTRNLLDPPSERTNSMKPAHPIANPTEAAAFGCKRKARNKKSSLRALVENQKPNTSTPNKPKLDLFDFLKS